MGLAGYVDRDRTLNEAMNNELVSSYGISYIRGEKVREVTPIQGPKKINALYKDWGFPGADILQIRQYIYALLNSFLKVVFVYPVGYDEEVMNYSKQCYRELMQCIAKENGFDEIIQLERLDRHFFSSIYWQYIEGEISKKRACSFVEHYLSCRVRGMSLLDEKDKEALLLDIKVIQLEEQYKDMVQQNEASVKLKEAFLQAVDVDNPDYQKIIERIDGEISQQKEIMIKNREKIAEIKEKVSTYASVVQLLLYGTRDIDPDIKRAEKIINM